MSDDKTEECGGTGKREAIECSPGSDRVPNEIFPAAEHGRNPIPSPAVPCGRDVVWWCGVVSCIDYRRELDKVLVTSDTSEMAVYGGNVRARSGCQLLGVAIMPPPPPSPPPALPFRPGRGRRPAFRTFPPFPLDIFLLLISRPTPTSFYLQLCPDHLSSSVLLTKSHN